MKKSQSGVGTDKWVHHCYAAIERGLRRVDSCQTTRREDRSASDCMGMVGRDERWVDPIGWYTECAEPGDEGMMRWLYGRWRTAPDVVPQIF